MLFIRRSFAAHTAYFVVRAGKFSSPNKLLTLCLVSSIIRKLSVFILRAYLTEASFSIKTRYLEKKADLNKHAFLWGYTILHDAVFQLRKDRTGNLIQKLKIRNFFILFTFFLFLLFYSKATMVSIQTIPTSPFDGQKPGTSGLRKRVKVFQEKNYTENFIQSMLEAIPAADGGAKGATLVVGGDGRFYSDEVLQTIVKCSVAQGVSVFFFFL